MNSKILVVEDDLDLNFILCKILQKAGYKIESAYSGQVAKQLILQNEYDLILLDLMLPEITGEMLIQIIRKKFTTPIMIISSKTQIEDRVSTLENGADDYLTKPFEQQEVLARVGALLRRYKQFSLPKASQNQLIFKNVVIDMEERSCTVNGKTLILTGTEYDVLQLLLQQPKKVFTKAQLYEQIWGDDYMAFDNALNVHVSNLRKKLKQYDEENEYIETVWGVGFKLKD